MTGDRPFPLSSPYTTHDFVHDLNFVETLAHTFDAASATDDAACNILLSVYRATMLVIAGVDARRAEMRLGEIVTQTHRYHPLLCASADLVLHTLSTHKPLAHPSLEDYAFLHGLPFRNPYAPRG